MESRTVAIGPVLPPNTWHFNITSLAPIEFLSSDRIMTQSICKLWSFVRSFTARFQMCNPTHICWVAIDQAWISHEIWCQFPPNSMNIGQIANLKAGGERAQYPVQSMNWPYHDTIGTQLLNWSQQCSNCTVETADRFQPAQKLTLLCPVRGTIPRMLNRSGSLVVPNPDWGANSSSKLERSRVTRNCC
jgi:hypothetical protein